MRDFFLKVEARLREKGLTIEEFSKAAGISPATYHRWQTGAVPRGSTVRRVARVLDLPFDQVFRPIADLVSEPQRPEDERVMKQLSETSAGACSKMTQDELLETHSDFLSEIIREPKQLHRMGHATVLRAVVIELDQRLKTAAAALVGSIER